MLPVVDFCGLESTRLIIGANPFGGFSHQSGERDREMLRYYSTDRIKETWERAAAAGINTMVTNNTSEHVLKAVNEYLASGGDLQWIAQVKSQDNSDMFNEVDKVMDIGCKAIYFHGNQVDSAYSRKDGKTLKEWCNYVQRQGIPVGVAAHEPKAHLWVDSLDIVDFHAVCFFNCGSLHDGQGEKFNLSDMQQAAESIRSIRKPCIGYKVMGAGRIEPRMALEYAFEMIKPTDIVNIGIYRGDKDDMVEEDVRIAREVLD